MDLSLPFLRSHKDSLRLGRTGPHGLFPHVPLSVTERQTHMYVVGITGQGKSKLLQYCLFQDITAGRGCGLLDPHADLARDLLAQLYAQGYFREQRNRERFIWFDPTVSMLPFNVLAGSQAPYTVAVNVVEAFRRTWPDSLREAPRFTNILLASLLALIANRLTLTQLPHFLTDKSYRNELLEQVGDPEIVSVFHDRLDRWGREEPLILESVLNKISALTLNPILRQCLGHPENHLDFRRMMDEGQVLIVDLGRCDGETRRLLGSLIVTGVEQAALSRKDEPARARRPFYFYLDEFQDFVANEGSATTLSHILSESRKFGLHLTLAHQTLGQMPSDRMRAALGNIGTKIVFAVDRVDAEILAKKLFQVDGEQVKHEVEDEAQVDRTHPVFYSLLESWEQATQTIQNLKPRQCLVKTPQKSVRKMYTVPIPSHTLSPQEWAALQTSLTRVDRTEPAEESKRELHRPPLPAERASYYEPVAEVRVTRQKITP